MELRLAVDGDPDEAAALSSWLTSENALRGRLRREAVPVAAGRMGGGADVVIELAGAAVSGVLGALAQALITFAVQRRRKVAISATMTGGTPRRLDIDGSDDVHDLLAELTRLAAARERQPGRRARGRRRS